MLDGSVVTMIPRAPMRLAISSTCIYMADNPGVVNTRQAVQIYKRAQYYEYANFAAANGDQIKDCSEYGLTFPEIPPSHEQGEQDL